MLSEPQQTAFDAMLDEYRQQHASLFKQRVARIRELADAGAALVLQGYPPECVTACEKFFDAQTDYLKAMTALDADVLTRLQSILSDEQVVLTRHIGLWRQRRRCLMSGWELRTAGIDLEQLAMMVLPAGDFVAFDSIRTVLAEYAEAVTVKFVDVDRATTRSVLDSVRIFADPAIAPEARAAVLSQKHASVARQEIALAELNQRFARKISESLAAPLNRAFMDAYHLEVFQLTYPDLPFSEASTESLLASPSLTAEQRDEIEALWRSQQSALAAITAAMVDRETRWSQTVSLTRSMQGKEEFAEFMQAKRAERWRLHQEYLQNLLAAYSIAMTAEQASQMRNSINDISRRIERSKDDGYPLMRSMRENRPPSASPAPQPLQPSQ